MENKCSIRHNSIRHKLSPEEFARATEEARIRKQQRISEAIKAGASVQYINCSLSSEERETIINISEIDGTATIESTIQRDITKCINKGWKINGITYRRSAIDPNDNLIGIVGMKFTAPFNKISILTCNSKTDPQNILE